MTDSMSLSIFTMVVNHRPIIAFVCKKHSEAEAICADERVQAKLGSLRSGGKPLLDDSATPHVRLARPDERALYYEQTALRSNDSSMPMVYLVGLDGPSPVLIRQPSLIVSGTKDVALPALLSASPIIE